MKMPAVMNNVPRTRVNGHLLSQHLGKEVVILGEVMKVNPNGMSFEIQTTDDQRVTVNMKHPLEESVSGYIEVRGTAQGRTMLTCDSYIMFPPETTALFDKAQFNTAITLMNSITNPWLHA